MNNRHMNKKKSKKSKSIVFMFSGQGSQYYHMGKELFHRDPIFRERMQELDGIIREIMGESVLERLYDAKKRLSDNFDRTRYTHPAIFMVEVALAEVMLEKGVKPDYVLGSSMGEFSAAAVSGVMPVKDILNLVCKQAELVETHCQKGGMLTILHHPDLYHQTPLLKENSQLAGVNYSTHFVVSGTFEQLQAIAEFLKQQHIDSQLLPVTTAFHSSLIDEAAPAFLDDLHNKKFQSPAIPFISCTYGRIITGIPADYFWQIARQPIIFTKALELLEPTDDYMFLDLGPSGTLVNFVKNNRFDNPDCFTFMSPFGGELKKIETFCETFNKTFGESVKSRSTQYREQFSVKKEEKNMNVYLFPGQGSQRKGMGKEIFDKFPELIRKADKVLGYSTRELCLEDPNDQLVQTQFTQPAVYLVNALSYLEKIRTDPKPDFVLGHSVGEYDALFASGVIDFETGLKLVKKRGQLMAQARGGGMAAVMGLSADKVEEILKANDLENLTVANYNSSFQLVISGLKQDIDRAEPIFFAAGATHYKILNVSGAFHTPYMADAKKKFNKYVKKFKFGEIAIPIISNVTARPYKQSEITDNIIEQITSPVRWMESIRYLWARGAEIEDFDEIGASGLSVVKALAIRIYNEAGPLDAAVLEAEETPTPDESKELPETGEKEVELEVKLEDALPRESEPEIEPVEPAETKEQPAAIPMFRLSADCLGSKEFKDRYHLKYAYLTGGMYKGIASKELVVKMGKAGFMGFLGTGGLELPQLEEAIRYIREELNNGQAYGMNMVANPIDAQQEEKTMDLYLQYGITTIEAAAFMQVTPALVRYRAKGLSRDSRGEITIANRLIAKISRPEVAEQFLCPAPERIVKKLLAARVITPEQGDLLKQVPMADDLCVEADSGGHTDQRMPYALMPAIIKLRDQMMEKYGYNQKIHVGAAGGIGTPEAAAAAFILGADFILTGSINQCTVEARTSDAVKDMLQEINVQDTDYAPAADMFEMGAKVQVLKKGVFFPARANKLYDLYRFYNSLDEIDEKTRKQIQERYFKRSFEEVYQDVKSFYRTKEIENAERNPKHKMALIFKWYFGYSTRIALEGNIGHKVDFQVQCGPALGAFNQWVKGTQWEDWRKRHVDEIAEKIMKETADVLSHRFHSISRST